MLSLRTTPSTAQLTGIKLLLFALCLIPALLLGQGLLNDTLGANPIEAITRSSGEWTLRFLLITLLVSPLRKYTGMHWLLRLRRMLGLYAFAYGVAHLLCYVWLDQFFDWAEIARDIWKRPFITVGVVALALMLPLALTSTNAAIRRLGGRRWQALHRSIYTIALLGCVHYWWLVKKDVSGPLLYTALTLILLGLRAWWREQERRRQVQGAYLKPPPLSGKVIRIFSR